MRWFVVPWKPCNPDGSIPWYWIEDAVRDYKSQRAAEAYCRKVYSENSTLVVRPETYCKLRILQHQTRLA